MASYLSDIQNVEDLNGMCIEVQVLEFFLYPQGTPAGIPFHYIVSLL
jgi:hypothetical protein